MNCRGDRNVIYVTFKLVSNVEYWWMGTKRLLDVEAVEVTGKF